MLIMKLPNTILAVALFIGIVDANAAPMSNEIVGEIAGVHGTVLASIIECRPYIDSPSARAKKAALQMQQALQKALEAEGMAVLMTEKMQATLELSSGQLKKQFDEIGADPDFRRQKCEQLIAGSAARAEQVDVAQGVK